MPGTIQLNSQKMLETSLKSTLRLTETYENYENNALNLTVKIYTDDAFLNQANHIHQNVRDSEAKMIAVDIHSHWNYSHLKKKIHSSFITKILSFITLVGVYDIDSKSMDSV